MKEEKLTQVISFLNGKIPEEKLAVIRNKLVDMDDKMANEILSMSLHNPTHILLFSIFLGGLGVDRFLIGDVGLGIGKLLLGGLTCGLWPLIDIFVSYKSAKLKNFNKIMLSL